jgi:hypothetical protein
MRSGILGMSRSGRVVGVGLPALIAAVVGFAAMAAGAQALGLSCSQVCSGAPLI